MLDDGPLLLVVALRADRRAPPELAPSGASRRFAIAGGEEPMSNLPFRIQFVHGEGKDPGLAFARDLLVVG